MDNNIKMRAKLNGEIAEVKVIMSHPMDTGRRKDDFDPVSYTHLDVYKRQP